MNILIYAFADRECGQGHMYRALALARAAESMGHHVRIAGNFMSRERTILQVRKHNQKDFEYAAKITMPDWVVIDLQHKPEDFLYDGYKTLHIGGVGRAADFRANATVIQGIYPYGENDAPNLVHGPEYVIVRHHIWDHDYHPADRWFVFGGSADKMGLLDAFSKSMPDQKAMLIASRFSSNGIPDETDNHMVYWPVDEAIFRLMARSSYACVATGMVVWELLAMGVPVYAYSTTPGHAHFAVHMQTAGLIRYNPGIGIPGKRKMRELLLSPPVIPKSGRPDALGAMRIIEHMETVNG